MRYMLLICGEEPETSGSEGSADLPGCDGWAAEMARRGVLLGGAGLQPSGTATTVRVRDDEVLIVDGPFAETKDQIGGFALIECADLDEAIEVASSHPAAGRWSVEIRPIWE
ncbi:YciI family protein [Rhizohabitans arisaemae]|uniref:YciI family protein n=1 Tax=Rhizohabitans arisaemae TaxID=2720610 RepID=UPI0024B211C7|nr:YciI family protein [Rhizohabitans arisaemae]